MMFLRSCSFALRRTNPHVSLRAFSSSRSGGKEHGALDLDSWKAVMRSQALREEGVTQRGSSALDSTRQLVEIWHQAGKLVPENITDEELEELNQLTARAAKKKYLKFLAIKESYKKAKTKKQETQSSEERVEAEAEAFQESEKEPKNSFLMYLRSSTVDQAQTWRAARALRFGQPLVYDMSYEQQMSRQELKNSVMQLMESEGCNRRAADPFHLHFCSLRPDGAYLKELLRRYGEKTWEQLMITASEKTHLEMFPQRDLVYLTADSKQVLQEFDHSKVYIIGALVDRSVHTGLSMANAKRQRLATARLPLDEYLNWERGAKTLTLDQMMRIMITLKETGSWEKALEFVPKRKHSGFTGFTKSHFVRNDSPKIRFPAGVQNRRDRPSSNDRH
ncbi:tRNA methyltransferase 10 homolog C [Puntigrus tetrazona]|uniref:tRNA methyltransferase 10 homolog C n=1 Tax=Puntigrus tetrazona TaxID=1606681 RepID=UPI001C8A2B72|nr:tRNA methyltransferase 10 homolog C [Puntigrus tetrazona]